MVPAVWSILLFGGGAHVGEIIKVYIIGLNVLIDLVAPYPLSERSICIWGHCLNPGHIYIYIQLINIYGHVY